MQLRMLLCTLRERGWGGGLTTLPDAWQVGGTSSSASLLICKHYTHWGEVWDFLVQTSKQLNVQKWVGLSQRVCPSLQLCSHGAGPGWKRHLPRVHPFLFSVDSCPPLDVSQTQPGALFPNSTSLLIQTCPVAQELTPCPMQG